MLAQLLHGSLLIFVTVAIHAFTLSWCLQHLIPQTAPDDRSFLQTTLLIARIALLVILAHLAGILVWSLYYLFNGIVPHMEEAFLFQRRHLRDDWLRRHRPASRLALAGIDGGLNWDSHVFVVRWLLFRSRF